MSFRFPTLLQLTGDTWLHPQSRWFSRVLYLFTLLKCGYWLARFDLFFGADALFPFKPHQHAGLREIPFFLYDHSEPAWSLAAIGLSVGLCIYQLISKRYRLAAGIVLWLCVLNIHYKTYGMLTGGDFLLNQFLLFGAFLSPFGIRPSRWQVVRTILHNSAVAGLMLQVCLVYFIAGLAKLADSDWRSGSALSLILSVEHYRTFALPSLPAWVLLPVSYLIIAYQLLFPVLIWLKPLKKTIILIGVAMNLFVMIGMGLVSFGATMLIGYILFVRHRSVVPAQTAQADSPG